LKIFVHTLYVVGPRVVRLQIFSRKCCAQCECLFSLSLQRLALTVS